MKSFITGQVKESCNVKQQILSNPALIESIKTVGSLCVDVYRKGNKTLLAGNGGSAADAQHIAGEFVSKFYFDRPGIPSMALTTDTSILTAIGNDYGYKQLFARQVQANAKQGDLFLGISTSGHSENVVEALKVCQDMGVHTVGLTGESVGAMDDFCDFCIKVPSKETPRIQECHIMIGHIICALVEEELFGKGF